MKNGQEKLHSGRSGRDLHGDRVAIRSGRDPHGDRVAIQRLHENEQICSCLLLSLGLILGLDARLVRLTSNFEHRYGINGCGVRKGKKQPELNAASIQFTDALERQYQISRESAIDKNGAVSMILIREKIESVTKEVGLIDAVSSSPASKEVMPGVTSFD
ncbi:hypothetical protein L2E82_37451 [Cichorium intybus]|uniref:Uncharacterized protein n=1 Tax=Cichorium intybus TaxID=13427 RepID=A0ACB9AF66_CICIN|nr:hypothetical protein L2E82_37451 [Cichorium intybus]